MNDLPLPEVLSSINKMRFQSPLTKETVVLVQSKLYFTTSNDVVYNIDRLTEPLIRQKPYYPAHFVGYYRFTAQGLDVTKFGALFRRAKLDNVHFSIHKYNGKFIEDTDVVFSQLHPYLLIEFRQQLGYKAMVDMNAIEVFEPADVNQALLIKCLTAHEYMVDITCDPTTLMDTLSMGLMINQGTPEDDDTTGLTMTLFQTYFSLHVLHNEHLYPLIDDWMATQRFLPKHQEPTARTFIQHDITAESVPGILSLAEMITQHGDNIQWSVVYHKTVDLC